MIQEGTAQAARGRWGAGLTLLAAVGLAIAAYLLTVRLLGEPPVCGPIRGCDVVAASEYATVFGVPVALLGAGFSTVLVAAAAAWWRRAQRRALYALYGLGLLGVIAAAYLTYLELFVIEAICVWCVTYALSLLVGWLGAVLTARLTED